jgi:hypothetical protein
MRQVIAVLIGCCLMSVLPGSAQAYVMQSGPGKTSQANVTLQVNLLPRIDWQTQSGDLTNIKVAHAPKSLSFIYNFKTSGKTKTSSGQGAKTTDSHTSRSLQLSPDQLGSKKESPIDTLLRETFSNNGKQSKDKPLEGTLEISAVYL